MKPIINLVLDHWYEQLGFYVFLIVVAGGFILGIISIVKIFLEKGGRIQAKGVTVSGAKTDGMVTTPAHPLPPHASCPHSGDIMSVVAKTAEFVEMKHRMPLYAIERQMKYFEEKEVELQGILLRAFIKELDEMLPKGTEIVQHVEYIAYNATLIAVGRFLKDYVRVAMRQNHFVDLTGDAWAEKKNRYKIMIAEKGTELLNLYWRGELIPRWRLYDINHDPELVRALNTAIDELFEYARDESKKLDDEIGRFREEYETFLRDKITG